MGHIAVSCSDTAGCAPTASCCVLQATHLRGRAVMASEGRRRALLSGVHAWLAGCAVLVRNDAVLVAFVCCKLLAWALPYAA